MLQQHFAGKQGKVWGTTTRVFHSSSCIVEHISIKQGWRCSKHRHHHRHNQFYVISGRLRIIADKDGLTDETVLTAGQSMTVPHGIWHRFEAMSDVEAVEVYWVEMVMDDIERMDHGGPIPCEFVISGLNRELENDS
jgi:mannose-6-phosphate isomerase-like protein (cupin superfamily)